MPRMDALNATPSPERLLRIVETCHQIIAAASHFHRSMRSIVENVTDLTGAFGATLLLPDDEELVTAAASAGVRSLLGSRVCLQESFAGRIFAEGALLLSNDALDDPRIDPSRVRALNAKGVIGAPLREKGRVSGVLLVFASETNAFSFEDVSVVKLLAEIAGAAIEHARYIEETYRRNHYDPLTELKNKAGFDEALAAELTRYKRYGQTFSLLLFDLDHFREVNTIYGASAADDVLRCVGAIIDAQMRDTDDCFRLGADRFAVICPGHDDSLLAAQRIALAISAAEIDRKPLSCSHGSAQAMPSDDVHQLQARAHAALDDAKRYRRASLISTLTHS